MIQPQELYSYPNHVSALTLSREKHFYLQNPKHLLLPQNPVIHNGFIISKALGSWHCATPYKLFCYSFHYLSLQWRWVSSWEKDPDWKIPAFFLNWMSQSVIRCWLNNALAVCIFHYFVLSPLVHLLFVISVAWIAAKEASLCRDAPEPPAGRPHHIKSEKSDAFLAGQCNHSKR